MTNFISGPPVFDDAAAGMQQHKNSTLESTKNDAIIYCLVLAVGRSVATHSLSRSLSYSRLLQKGGNITISGLVSHWRYIPSIDARTAMKDIKLAAIGLLINCLLTHSCNYLLNCLLFLGSSNYVDVMMTNTPSEYVKALKDCAARRISLSTNERNGTTFIYTH